MKKILSIVVIVLFLGMTIIPSINADIKQNSLSAASILELNIFNKVNYFIPMNQKTLSNE